VLQPTKPIDASIHTVDVKTCTRGFIFSSPLLFFCTLPVCADEIFRVGAAARIASAYPAREFIGWDASRIVAGTAF
jgi:hypothetical protein